MTSPVYQPVNIYGRDLYPNKVKQTILDSNPRLYFIEDYGAVPGIDGDPTATTQAIQDASDDCAANGGGIVYGPNLYNIEALYDATTGLNFTHSNIEYQFGFDLLGGSSSEASAGWDDGTQLQQPYRTGLLWRGPDNGTMINCVPETFELFNNENGSRGLRIIFTGTLIAGEYPYTTAAAYCLRGTGLLGSELTVWSLEPKTAGLDLWCEDTDARYYPRSNAYNHIPFVGGRAWNNSGALFRVDGYISTPYAHNTYRNFIGEQYYIYNDGHGADWGDSDNNVCYGSTRASRVSGGTGNGVRLRAGDGTTKSAARFNRLGLVAPGAGGIYAEGTPTAAIASGRASATIPQPNFVIFEAEFDAPQYPTIEASAMLNVIDNEARGI